MNFLEICQRVLDEGDQVGNTLTTVIIDADTTEQHANVIRWVKKAYRAIQRRDRYWDFHHKTGVMITTEANKKDYSKLTVHRVLQDSITVRIQGQVSETDLTYLTYRQYRDLFTTVRLAPGFPRWLIHLPGKKWRIEPEPDKVYEILGDWYLPICELENNSDEPLWEEDLHELVAWVALEDFMGEYESSTTLGKRIKATLPGLWSDFMDRYHPEIELSGTFA